jgi:iron(III) transport system permease protein
MQLPRIETVLSIGVSLVVMMLVLPPLGAVILAGVGAGFAPLRHLDVVLNTLLFGLLTTLCAMMMGGALSLSLLPGVPGRGVLERLVIMPLYLTPLLTAMGWSWLGSPKSGLLNLVLHAALSEQVTINIVSAGGVIAVAALAMAPVPFLLLSDALRALDPSLLEAARVHGAVPRLVFRRIVLPLLMPASLASAVLVFVQAIGMFSVPAILGMPAGFNVATTEIYQSLESYPPRTADATAWGVLLLGITALLMLTQSVLLAGRSFVTITGKAFRPNHHSPRARWLRTWIAWLLTFP